MEDEWLILMSIYSVPYFLKHPMEKILSFKVYGASHQSSEEQKLLLCRVE